MLPKATGGSLTISRCLRWPEQVDLCEGTGVGLGNWDVFADMLIPAVPFVDEVISLCVVGLFTDLRACGCGRTHPLSQK